MSAIRRWAPAPWAFACVVLAAPAFAQSGADACAVISQVRSVRDVDGIMFPLARASDEARAEKDNLERRLKEREAVQAVAVAQANAAQAELGQAKFGAPSLADLDAAVAEAQAKREQRAAKLRRFRDAQRRLEAVEAQNKANPGSIDAAAITGARAEVAESDRDLAGESPLNVLDAAIAAAEAAANQRRAILPDLERKAAAAHAAVAERQAAIAALRQQLAVARANQAQAQASFAAARSCAERRIAVLQRPRDPGPRAPDPIYEPPVVYAPSPEPPIAPPVYEAGPPPVQAPGFAPVYAPQVLPPPVYEAPPPVVVEYPVAPVQVSIPIVIPFGNRDRPNHGPAYHHPQGRPQDHRQVQPQQHHQPTGGRPPPAQGSSMSGQHTKPPSGQASPRTSVAAPGAVPPRAATTTPPARTSAPAQVSRPPVPSVQSRPATPTPTRVPGRKQMPAPEASDSQ